MPRSQSESRRYPEAGSPAVSYAESSDNPDIEDAGNPVVQAIGVLLPDAGFNPAIPSLLDIQCSLPPAVLPQSRSLRVRPTRRPRVFTPLCISTQANILSLLSIPASSPSAPTSDTADPELPESRSSQRKQTQLQSVRKKPQKPITIVTAATRNRKIESRPSSNRSLAAAIQSQNIELDADRDGVRAENSEVNRVA